jgi:hypothetical protein
MRRELSDFCRVAGTRSGRPAAPRPPRHADADGASSTARERGLAPALAFFLRRQGCAGELRQDGTVLVELPHQLYEQQAGMELELYVRLWEVLHGTRIEVLD